MMKPPPRPDPSWLRLSPEDRLCLLLARGSLSAAVREEALALLAQPLDWTRITERAGQHEVYPLLFRNLKEMGFTGVSDVIRKRLEALSRVNALRSSLITEELVRLLAALRHAGIPAIPFKGPFLADRLYGDPTLRVCADLDILVPPAMMPQAVAALLAQEYRADFSAWFLSPRMVRNNFEYPLSRSQRELNFHVELHWGVLWARSSKEDSAEQLWREAAPASFASVPAFRLSPEWEFLFLAAHAARHQWQGLKWLVDLDAFCAQETVDWSKARAHARKLGWERLAQQTFGVCHALLETPVPAPFTAMLPGKLRWYPAAPLAATPWQNTRLCLSLAQDPIEKLRMLLRRIFVPNLMDGACWRFPDSLGFLYYALRPARLALDLLRRPFANRHASLGTTGEAPGTTEGAAEGDASAVTETSAAAVPAIQEKK